MIDPASDVSQHGNQTTDIAAWCGKGPDGALDLGTIGRKMWQSFHAIRQKTGMDRDQCQKAGWIVVTVVVKEVA